MKDYRQYTLEDFLSDESFQEYVRKSSADAVAFWENWKKSNPGQLEIAEEAERVLSGINFQTYKLDEYKYQKDLHRLRTAIQPKDKFLTTRDKRENVINFKISRSALQIAASLLLLVAVSFIFWKSDLLDFGNREENLSAVEWVEKVVDKGEKVTLTMKDGSKIKLNSESKLRFPENFAPDKREVYLEGEAFFEVAKDSNRPFTIYSGNLSTTVLGTAFNVRAYSNEKEMKVALLEGKVKVTNQVNAGENMLLSPMEMASLNKEKNNLVKKEFLFEDELGWKDGLLLFKNANFEEIRLKLERWYGVSFIIQNNPKLVKGYSGRFENESLEEVLEGISFTSGFKFKMEKGNVIIN
ncbi:FecR family protein [Flexithrix dorotheae]|uniref:FecR family protein n=1 Tax=Flexithrix dorotheae TaxID=70993 RepID=UPI000372BD00|nr:FecR family protein [Flexithrix dorotheae]